MNPRQTARLSSAAIATCAFAVAASAGTVVEARWLAPVSGNWFDGANWSTGVPPVNTEGVLYDVIIDAVGAPYISQGVFSTPVAMRSVLVDSPNVTVRFGNVNLSEGFELRRGLLDIYKSHIGSPDTLIGKGAAVVVSGNGAFLTFNGAVRNHGDIHLQGTARLNGTAVENYGNLFFTDAPSSLSDLTSLSANHGLISVEGGARRIELLQHHELGGEIRIAKDASLRLTAPSGLHLSPGATFTGEGQLTLFTGTIYGDFLAPEEMSVLVASGLTVNGSFTVDDYELFQTSPTGSLTVSNATTIRNDVSFTNRTITSGGLFRVGGSLTATRTGSADGSLTLDGGLSVGGNATISVPTTVGADALFEGNLVQNIAYTQTAGDLTVLGNLTHTGNQRISIDQGELFVGGNATFTVGQRNLDFDATITGAASLNAVDVEARLTAGRVNALGAFGVRGEVVTQDGAFIQRGVFAPGLLNQVGEARFVGDFTMSDNPLLTTRIDLVTDAARGVLADSVIVEGDLTLGGAFVLSLAGDASPLEEGQQWRLFDADSRAGFFSTTTLPALQGDLALVLRYDQTGLTLRVVPTPGALSLLALTGGALVRRRRPVRASLAAS